MPLALYSSLFSFEDCGINVSRVCAPVSQRKLVADIMMAFSVSSMAQDPLAQDSMTSDLYFTDFMH